MAKVSDIYGTKSRMKFNQFDFANLSLEKIWVDYDELTDSIVCYFTGKLVRAISVHLQDGFHVMVNPMSKEVVGIHIEHLEKFFLPQHPIFQTSWPYVRQVLSEESDSMLCLFSFGLASLIPELSTRKHEIDASPTKVRLEDIDHPLKGTILKYDDPCEPVAVDDWKVLQADPL